MGSGFTNDVDDRYTADDLGHEEVAQNTHDKHGQYADHGFNG